MRIKYELIDLLLPIFSQRSALLMADTIAHIESYNSPEKLKKIINVSCKGVSRENVTSP